MKYKIRILSIAIATIVLLAMGATLSVSAAPTVGSAAPIVGAPSICFNAAGTKFVFCQGSNNHLWVNATPVNGGNWKDLGGTLTAAPAAVYQGTDLNTGGARISVFVRGTDGLYVDTSTNNGATWTWSKLSVPGGVAAGTGPAAVSEFTPAFPAARLNAVAQPPPTVSETWVFWVNSAGNHLYVSLIDPTTGAVTSQDLRGIVTASPGAVINALGSPVVFVRGTDGGLYEKMGTTTTWGGYTKFNRGILLAGTGPTAVLEGGSVDGTGATADSDGGTQITLLVTGTNNHVYEEHTMDGGAGVTWNTIAVGSRTVAVWTDLGITMTSSPSAAINGSGVSSIFVVSRGGNGHVWEFENLVPAPKLLTDWGVLSDIGSP